MTFPAPTHDELAALLYEEARLLDDGEYEAWLRLFTESGRYWMPLKGREQRDGDWQNSIADEDLVLLRIRIKRLLDGRAHSQQPASRCQHVLQRPTLISSDDEVGRWTLRTPFSYQECRGNSSVTLFGHYVHVLCRPQDKLQIELKRINLVNADAALPMIQLLP
jgi:3-phenylpropionate/cinnamic acid dioxygenase small subunit